MGGYFPECNSWRNDCLFQRIELSAYCQLCNGKRIWDRCERSDHSQHCNICRFPGWSCFRKLDESIKAVYASIFSFYRSHWICDDCFCRSFNCCRSRNIDLRFCSYELYILYFQQIVYTPAGKGT